MNLKYFLNIFLEGLFITKEIVSVCSVVYLDCVWLLKMCQCYPYFFLEGFLIIHDLPYYVKPMFDNIILHALECQRRANSSPLYKIPELQTAART